MASSPLDRLLNASPRSVGRWIKSGLGARSLLATRPLLPVWEKIVAGPLAGREVLLDRRGSGAWEDMIHGRFDTELYAALARAVPASGGVLWDVGAHMGFHTLGFAAMVGPAGRVVGFEPNPSNRERLRQNLEKNADLAARVEILSCALSDRVGESAFVLSHDIDTGASSMSFLDGTTPAVAFSVSRVWDTIVVPLRTVDGLVRDGVAPPPDALKVDVEGAELLVLRGAEATVRASQPAVIVEVHSARLVYEVQQWLWSHGYAVRLLADVAPSRVLLGAAPPGRDLT
ncbi:MAG TPA: FkbM family methyltransferase [Vicinamibacterales bacterium]